MGRIFGHRRNSSRVPVTRRSGGLSWRDLPMGQGSAGWRTPKPRRALWPALRLPRLPRLGARRPAAAAMATSAPPRATRRPALGRKFLLLAAGMGGLGAAAFLVT